MSNPKEDRLITIFSIVFTALVFATILFANWDIPWQQKMWILLVVVLLLVIIGLVTLVVIYRRVRTVASATNFVSSLLVILGFFCSSLHALWGQ